MQIDLLELQDQLEAVPTLEDQARQILRIALSQPKTLEELDELLKIASNSPYASDQVTSSQISVPSLSNLLVKARFHSLKDEDDFI